MEDGGSQKVLQVRFVKLTIMKTLATLIFILLLNITYSQNNHYDEEWYKKLDSELEYITFPNPTEDKLNIRIYRGKYEEHKFLLTNTLGEIIISGVVKREDVIDITCLSSGIYFFTVLNDSKNLTQIVIIK
jgi:hypothetical protein